MLQKFDLRIKIVGLCLLAFAIFVGGCVGVYYSLRSAYGHRLDSIISIDTSDPEDCAQVIDDIIDLLQRSYLLSDEMMEKALTKLSECQRTSYTHIDVLSSSLNSLFYSSVTYNEELLSDSILRLADCCYMLNAYEDAEMMYSQILFYDFKNPVFKASACAGAHLGLARICVYTGRTNEAKEHVQNCLQYAALAQQDKFNDYCDVVLAEIQYAEGNYAACAQAVSGMIPGDSAQSIEILERYTLPLLSIKSLSAAHFGEYADAEIISRRLIRLASEHEYQPIIIRHLNALKDIYTAGGQPFPDALNDTLFSAYRLVSEENMSFLSEYALIEYMYYFQNSIAFRNNFLFIVVILLIPLVLVLQLIVRLFIKSQTDALTGLLNRGRFMHDRHISLRRSRECALIMFDIDDFKRINDTWGHVSGDGVLIRVAKEIYRHCGANSRAYRIGGEEFAIIVSNPKRFPPYTLAESIRSAVDALRWHEEGLHVTISGGVASGCGKDLYSRADKKLYYSKEHGKNRIS